MRRPGEVAQPPRWTASLREGRPISYVECSYDPTHRLQVRLDPEIEIKRGNIVVRCTECADAADLALGYVDIGLSQPWLPSGR